MENLDDCECIFYDGKKIQHTISMNFWQFGDANENDFNPEVIEHVRYCIKRCVDMERIVSASDLGNYEDSFPLIVSRKSNKHTQSGLTDELEQLTISSSRSDSLETGTSSFDFTGNSSFSKKSRSPQNSLSPQTSISFNNDSIPVNSSSKHSFSSKDNSSSKFSYRPGFGWAFMTSNSSIQMNFNDGISAILDIAQGIITITDPRGSTTNYSLNGPKVTDFEQNVSLIVRFKQQLNL